MNAALAAVLAGAIALPHLLRLQRVPPLTAIVLWLSGLALRAVAATLAVVLLLLFLPRTDAFMALTHWCLHALTPIEGHAIGDTLLYVPGALLVTSLAHAGLTTARDARSVGRLVEASAVGAGPGRSVVIGGDDVSFAVAGLARPRVLVSAGALARLDDAELAAALDHERAHIVRRHRYVMLLGIACRALGRPVPGAGRAVVELAFHLERDADRWALERRNDRLALASAICMAAVEARATDRAATSALGTTGVRERLLQLLDDPPAPRPRGAPAALNGLAVAMVAAALILAASLPAAAAAGATGDAHRGHHGQHCHHEMT